MDFKELSKEIRSGQLVPVYFFYGDEPYPSDSLVRLILEVSVDPTTRDFNCDLLSAEETDGKTIVDRAASFPLMAEKRFVFVRQIQKLGPSDRKILLQYLDHPSESTCLVLTSMGVETRQKFYQEIIRKSHWMESKPLYENQAVQWVTRRCEENQKRITPDAALFLVQQVGTSLWGLHNEIEKVLTFVPNAKAITREEVSSVAGISRQYNLWELTDAVARKDIRSALLILNHLLETRQSPSGIIIDLSRRIVQLFRVRACLDHGLSVERTIQELGLRPYFGKLYATQARQYTVKELGVVLKTLMMADHAIKTGRLDPPTAMTLLVYDVIYGARGRRYFVSV